MFVYNVKVNGSKIFKVFFTFVVLLIIFILGIVIFRIFGGASSNEDICIPTDFACVQKNGICDIASKNYTNILKAVHDNVEPYIGVKIHFTGYIYRLYDFKESQFVLARDMVISSDLQTVVVGFLCDYNSAQKFNDGTWVDITGEITKGSYHGDMPIIKIIDIKNVERPNEELVYPPDESYIPTNGIL